VLKFCKKSVKLNSELHDFVINILKYIPIIHCIFAVYIFGNPSIFLGEN
jgi:hypothetical protein